MIINHDFHIHTVYSNDTDKTATVENYVGLAKEIGMKKLGFAEHFWDEKIEGAFEFYKPLTFEHLLPSKEIIKACKDESVKVYFGCEVEYNPKILGPAITEEIAEQFDFITVPHSHSHETMPTEYYQSPQKHLDFILDAYYNILDSNISKYITSMAHPFCMVRRSPHSRKMLLGMTSDDTLKRMFDKTAQKGIAIEINTSDVMTDFSEFPTLENINESSLMGMYRIAKECGCRFIFGSDSHSLVHLKIGLVGTVIAEALGLTEDDIANIAR